VKAPHRHEAGGKVLRWWQMAVRGESKTFLARTVKKAAQAGSRGYHAGLKLREMAYAQGWFKSQRLPVPTVCVGNLTVGGTGKTPLVIRLAEDLLKLGVRPAVLLRGYRRQKKTAAPILVRDASRILATLAESGDEGMELARRLPGVCVAVGADRYAAGRAVMKHQPVDCFILDDGFQHHRLLRDYNIVAIDVSDPWGGGQLLPAGLLRESPEALARAQLVVLTRATSAGPDRLSVLRAEAKSLMRPDAGLIESRHEARELISLFGHKALALSALKGRDVLAVSGIGNPAAFESTLEGLGARLLGVMRHDDHAGSAADVFVWAEKHASEDTLVIMTEKDAVRWESASAPASLKKRLYSLRVSMTFSEGETLWQGLVDRIAAFRPTA
jgi:tetraacyldisaccharide 4'-kinase